MSEETEVYFYRSFIWIKSVIFYFYTLKFFFLDIVNSDDKLFFYFYKRSNLCYWYSSKWYLANYQVVILQTYIVCSSGILSQSCLIEDVGWNFKHVELLISAPWFAQYFIFKVTAENGVRQEKLIIYIYCGDKKMIFIDNDVKVLF